MTRQTAVHWKMDNAPVLGAALAYYAVLVLPEVLILVLCLVSLFYGSHIGADKLSEQLGRVVGKEAGEFLGQLIADPKIRAKAPMTIAIAVLVFFIAATGFFVELQRSVNSAWGVKKKSKMGLLGLLVLRTVTFAVLLGVGILLMLSVVVSSELTTVQHAFGYDRPWMTVVWHLLDFIVSCAIITVLFAMVFKFLPDAKVGWREVWTGSLVTAVLFTIGKSVIALYLAHSSTPSTFGVAGSFVLLLIWINYSVQIFLFGAEFTRIYAREQGRGIEPSEQAEWKDYGEKPVEERQHAAKPEPRQAANTKLGKPKAFWRWRWWLPGRRASRTFGSSVPRSSDFVHSLAHRVHGWRSFLHRETRE